MKLKDFSYKLKDGLVVIIDIGSGSVGGALVSLNRDQKPKILFRVRKPIVFQNKFKFERFLSAMLLATDHVLEELNKASSERPQQAFCILAAPWYVSQSRIARFEDKKTFVVTEKKVNDLIMSEIDNLKKKFNEHYKNFTESKAEIIEVENIHMKLNGYETNSPYGKKTKKLEAYLYISMSADQVLRSLRQKVRKTFGLDNVFFNSFSLAAFDTIRDIYSEKQNFIFIDIGGEMTDVSVTRDGILVETLSFPLGRNFLLRTIANELQTVKEEAFSLFNLYMEKKTSDTYPRKMKNALAYVEKEWSEAFHKTLGSLASRVSLPGYIFVIADIPFGKWFSEVIKNKGSGDIILMGGEIEITLINPLVLNKFVISNMKTSVDTFIITEALFIDKLLKSKI